MREYKVIIKYPIECDFIELCESDSDAYQLGMQLAITDAKELAGTRGIRTWENILNENIDEISDMTLEEANEFVDSKYKDYLNSIIVVDVEEV